MAFVQRRIRDLLFALGLSPKQGKAEPAHRPAEPPSPQRAKDQWFQEGDALKKLGRYEEALVAYDQAIHLDPTYALVYYNKSFALGGLKRPKEAREAFQKAQE